MKKILFISHLDEKTGASFFLYSLIKSIKNVDFDIITLNSGVFFSSLKPVINFNYQQPNFFKRVINRIKNQNNFALQQKIFFTEINAKNYDLIYANTVVSCEYALKLKENIKDVRLLLHIHEMPFAIDTLLKDLQILCDDRIDHYIVVNKQIEKFLIKNLKIEKTKISLCYPFNDLVIESFKNINQQKTSTNNKKNFTVGIIGNALFIKGFDLLPQLLKNLKDKNIKDITIKHAGSISDIMKKQLEFDLLRLGVNHLFEPLGEIKNPKTFYNDIDLLISLSREESFSFAFVENTILKKPFLCFQDSIGAMEIIDQKDLVEVPYQNFEEFANKIISIKENAELRNEISLKIHKELIANYSPILEKKKNLEIIDNIIK